MKLPCYLPMQEVNEKKQMKKVFIKGPIPPQFIADSLANLQTEQTIGAHNIFGSGWADQVNKVVGIDYTCYEEIANIKFDTIREEASEKYKLTSIHIHHSLGVVNAGEICLFILVSSKRRKQVYEATEYIVNRVKEEVPIFGKELLDNEAHQWKVNR